MKSDLVKNWLLLNVDICFVSETHLKPEQRFEVPPFVTINNPYNGKSKKPRGGVSCFIQDNCLPFVKSVDKSTNDMICITLRGGHKVFSNYIPPVDSIFFKDEMFTCIANEFLPGDNGRIVFGGGDMNCRIGNLIGKPGRCSEYRDNPDAETNSHGRFLNEICRSFNCFPLNNLTHKKKLFDGKFTYYKGNKKSQNDIILGNHKALDCIENFTIHEISFNPSDHFPLVVNCNFSAGVEDHMPKAAADLLTDAAVRSHKPSKKIRSPDVNWEDYAALAQSEIDTLQTHISSIETSPTESGLNRCINKLSTALYNAARTCTKKDEAGTPATLELPFQNLLEQSDEALSQFISGQTGAEDWHAAKALVLKENKKHHFGAISKQWATAMASKDAKEVWNLIDWKGEVDGSKRLQTDLPSTADLAAHFLTKGDAHDPIDITLLPKNQHVDMLDKAISMEELKDSSKLLKEKSTSDGWCPQMINTIHSSLFPVILILFNIILSHAFFPVKWCLTVVAALFKNKGLAKFAQYYRPITLVQLLYKWFDFVLLGRFKKWFVPADGQTAYQDKRGCPDHIFLMRCMISYAKTKTKKFFICTIDFDGAFDRVSRTILLKKLALFGAGSVFLLCIAAMYQRTESIIIQKDNHCTYELLSGIKQGLPLSPYLFLFYINDVFDFFHALYSKASNKILEKIHLLIHADDANIFASSRTMLIAKLQSMLKYCDLNKIRLQLSKCMFMVINGSGEDRTKIVLDAGDIKASPDVLILGSHLVETGLLKDDLKLHFDLRFKNCIKYFNFVRSNRLAPIAIKLKVLSACVTSTLLYNCEAFGPLLPNGLEALYFKLIKSALNVRPNTPNDIVLIESGLLPLKALVHKRQLSFFRRFKDSLRRNSERESVFLELSEEENLTTYLQHYIKLDRAYVKPSDIYKEASLELKRVVREKSVSDEHYKYYIYHQFNPELLPSPFLACAKGADAITRFRLGSHNLPIETGRWGRVKREERLCRSCQVLGDERHILYQCVDVERDSQLSNNNLSEIWKDENIFKLFQNICKTDYL